VAREKSGLYYPNKIGRIYLMAMEEVMGTNGIKAVLNLAKTPELIGNVWSPRGARVGLTSR
jgi:hypothetical protein